MKRKFNRTKIIATIGPASNKKEVLSGMVAAGVNLFRFNFSHGSYDEYREVIRYVSEINRERITNVGIIADLQGPKIRVGKIANNHVNLKAGSEVEITTTDQTGNAERFSINYAGFPKDIRPGEPVLVDDGKIELKVLETNRKDLVRAKVVYGGPLSSNKGINLPNSKVSLPSLTEKDRKDLRFALENAFNWIALSFVRSAKDVLELKALIKKHRTPSKVIAKIEKPEAIDDIDAVIDNADAIMIARGDLGVEVPMEEVPVMQKTIVGKCIRASKPVIIATQIIESMIDNPNPTRAEVTDVANVVYEGADALMLSGETSIGQFPVKVIETISKIIAKIEKEQDIYLAADGSNKWRHIPSPGSETFLSDAICYNACKISVEVKAKALIGMTQSGYTAFIISSFRPRAKIFIFTNNRFLLNTLSLVWGAKGFYYDKMESTDGTIYDVKQILKESRYVKSGDIVINTASMPLHEKGRTNMLKVSKID